MANYMGMLDSFNEVQSPINLELVNQVLSVKQGKYDKNLAEVDATLAEMNKVENLLLRDEDKKYLANNVRAIVDTINSSGKIDLSKNNVARRIKADIAKTQDNYIVDQIAQSQKYRYFEQSLEKLKEKNPDKYDVTNHNDALQMAGFQDYMSHRTNKLNNLQYQEYINVEKELNDYAQKYAEKMGFERIIGGGYTDEGLRYKTEKGKIVTQAELYEAISSRIDPKMQAQMQINARATFGGMSDENFNKYMTDRSKKEIEANKTILAAEKATLDSLPESQKKEKKAMLLELGNSIKKDEQKLATGKFNRNEMYSVYNKDLIGQIASAHDIKALTDVDYDDFNFEVQKHQDDMAYKQAVLAQKDREAAQKNSPRANVVGTLIENPTVQPEIPKTDIDILVEGVQKTRGQLDSYLQQNDPAYKAMNTTQRVAYISNMAKQDVSALGEGNNKTKIKLLREHKRAADAYNTTLSKLGNKVNEDMGEVYESIRAGAASGGFRGLNKENLSGDLPSTVAMIDKYNKPYNQLTKAQKLMVDSELLASSLRSVDLDATTRQQFKEVLARNKVSLKMIPGAEIMSRQLEETAKNTTYTSWANAAKTNLTSGAVVFKNALDLMVGNKVSRLWDTLTKGSDIADKRYQENVKEDVKDLAKVGTNLRDKSLGYVKELYGGTDSNVSELEPYDLGGRDDVSTKMINKKTSYDNIVSEAFKPFKDNIVSDVTVSFSKALKEEKDLALEADAVIRNAIRNGADLPPPTGENFSVRRVAGGWEIGYTSGKEEKTITVPKLSQQLSGAIYDNLNENWFDSFKNQNIKMDTFTVNYYKTPEDATIDLETFFNNSEGQIMSAQDYVANINNREGSAFATASEIKDFYVKRKPEKVAQHEKQINEILSTNYRVVPRMLNGTPVMDIKNEEGKLISIDPTTIVNSMGDKYDPVTMEYAALVAVNNLKKERIEKLIN